MAQDWVFGYASLINEEVRRLNKITGEATPVEEFPGFKREWDPSSLDSKRAKLTLRISKDSSINGVIVPVSDSGLEYLDGMNNGYTRVCVDEHLNGKDPKSNFKKKGALARVWAYLPNTSLVISSNNPIVQSHVDAVVGGALCYGEPFANTLVTTTEGWNNTWVNDRSNPVYRHLEHHTFDTMEVDYLLERRVREAFSQRVILPS